MKASEATWIAIVCAASAAALIRPMRKTAALNSDTSKTSVSAIGNPSRQSARKRAQSGRQKRPKRR